MRKRLEWRGIDCEVAAVRRDDPLADLSDVDVILIGGGGDNEQLYVCKHLMEYKNELRNYIEDNGSLIAICGGYQLLGNYYKLQNETIKGLEILDIYTEIGKGRLIGDIILEADFLNEPHNLIVGFENHGGRTYIGSHTPFGKVLYGMVIQIIADMTECYTRILSVRICPDRCCRRTLNCAILF